MMRNILEYSCNKRHKYSFFSYIFPTTELGVATTLLASVFIVFAGVLHPTDTLRMLTSLFTFEESCNPGKLAQLRASPPLCGRQRPSDGRPDRPSGWCADI